MATQKQIEAAKKALADGYGIGAAIDAAEAAAWDKIENALVGNGSEPFLAYISGHGCCVCVMIKAGLYNNSKKLNKKITRATHYRPLPQPPKTEGCYD